MLNEIAKSYIESELEKINSLSFQRMPDFVKRICRDLISYLEQSKDVKDRADLIALRMDLLLISDIVDILLLASSSKSSWWALPLIRECYTQCGIPFEERNILIIHSHEIGDYGVYSDIVSFFPFELASKNKPIDVFKIPAEASYDIASIALIGHEVGHVYWNIDTNFSLIKNAVIPHFEKADLFNRDQRKKKINRFKAHIEEYLCDKVGAYLLGPAFDLALLKLFCSQATENSGGETHPPEKSRIEQAFRRFKSCQANEEKLKEAIDKTAKVLDGIHNPTLKDDQLSKDNQSQNNDQPLQHLAIEIFQNSSLKNFEEEKDINEIWKKVTPELDAFRPPFEKVSDKVPVTISPIETVIASCIYYHGKTYYRTNDYFLRNTEDDTVKNNLFRKTLVNHIKYSISLYSIVSSAHKKYCNFGTTQWKNSLWKMRERTSGGKLNPLIIVPSIDPEHQYGENSVDLRLGTSFLITKPSRYTHIDPAPRDGIDDECYLENSFEEVEIPVGQQFILHPHQFVLANTLEYVSLPFDYYALVLGRSSWGRLGLNIATATTVQAGFRGCLTLELRNLGEMPLPLNVGLRIAQLCLVPLSPDCDTHAGYFASDRKYIGPVSCELPKIKKDRDWKILKDISG